MKCDYGCNKPALYQLKNGKNCCSKRPAGCEVLKQLNSSKVKESYSLGQRKPAVQVYKDLPQQSKDKMAWSRGKVFKTIDEVFRHGQEWGSGLLRKYILHYNLKDYCCEHCGITEWRGKPLTLEIDHIDGNHSNNEITNLRWLCPNCHSQTPTFRGYNKSLTGKVKITDEELSFALIEESSIRKALQKVGLAAKGGNYNRAKKLLATLKK